MREGSLSVVGRVAGSVWFWGVGPLQTVGPLPIGARDETIWLLGGPTVHQDLTAHASLTGRTPTGRTGGGDHRTRPPRVPGRARRKLAVLAVAVAALLTGCADQAAGQESTHGGGEAALVLPDLSAVSLAGGVSGRLVLTLGLVVCLAGLGFGVAVFVSLKRLPVHRSMREVSELIYSTCKTYLLRQGRFLLTLWVFIAAVIVVYYRVLVGFPWGRVAIIIAFSLLGMAGSYGVAWFGIRVNTFANSRTAQAALAGKPLPLHRIPMRSGMSIGMVLIATELAMMLVILLWLPAVRRMTGDRAVMRALHFFADSQRTVDEARALSAGDMDAFLQLVNESGRSSHMYLQNVFPQGSPHHQAVGLTLALCDEFLGGRGAFRVHGGGFAGTVQAFVPLDMLDSFREDMDRVLGAGNCHALSIRDYGSVRVN